MKNINQLTIYFIVFYSAIYQIHSCIADCNACSDMISCDTCNSGYFVNGANICQACSSNCDACTSNMSCTACISGYLNQGGQCVISCSSNYYVSGLNCQICDPLCTQCTGSSASSCSACNNTSPSVAYLSGTSCLTSCPAGTYPSTSPNTCTPCDHLCTQCTGSSASSCSACNNTSPSVAYLSGTSCLTSCPAGTYPSTSPNTCTTCNTNCLTCSISSMNCLSCLTPKLLYNNICYSSCPVGSAVLNITHCISCDPKCAVCTNSITNCSACTLTGPNIGFLSGTTCVTNCPNGSYNDVTGGNICTSCHTNCLICLDGTNTQCSSCATGFVLSGTTCALSCLPGYGYFNATVCIGCSSECAGCYGLTTNCSSCVSTPVYYWIKLSSTLWNCVVSCPLTLYYVNSAAKTCPACPNWCLQCNSSSYCFSCQPTSLWANKLCYKPCPDNWYPINSTNCSQCSFLQCKTCPTDPAVCGSCMTGGSYRSFMLNTICFSICPAGYYGNTSSNDCKLCHANCNLCYGPLKSNCTQCTTLFYQSGNTCQTSCLTDYGITSVDYMCVKCDVYCTACSYIATNCSACVTSGNNTAYLFTDNVTYPKCLVTCPVGTVSDNATQLCLPCSAGCSSCDNITTNCTSCLSSFGLLNATCLNPCPVKYFLNVSICSQCNPYCVICSGLSTNCSQCYSSGTNASYLSGSTCIISCPPLTYPYLASTSGNTNNVCINCDSLCLICADLPTNCSSCISTAYLHLSNNCVVSCPTNYTPITPSMTCNYSFVTMKLSMFFQDSQTILVEQQFNYPIDVSLFPNNSFQNLSFDPQISMSLFTITTQWTSPTTHTITLTANSNIFLYDQIIKVKIMSQPTPNLLSTYGFPFQSSVYEQTRQLTWTLIKGPKYTPLEQSIFNNVKDMSAAISNITTLPGVEQLNKAGLLSMFFSSAQITSTCILLNSVHSPHFYQGARLWANMVYFTVPQWQKQKNKNKSVIVPSIEDIYPHVRLLKDRRMFEIDQVSWRYERTGFSSFFIFDCYGQIFLILLSWLMIIIVRKIDNQRYLKLSRAFLVFHAVHQICTYYFTIGLVLQWFYFELSLVRIISIFLCLFFNFYLLSYYLKVFYDLIGYPNIQIGTIQWRDITTKYSYFLRGICYQEWQLGKKWHPKHILRPYNYHLLSYYKIFLITFAVVLFYQYSSTSIVIVISIQVIDIVRFCWCWPYATLAKNITCLFLQLTLLLFFGITLVQIYLSQQMKKNDPNSLPALSSAYYSSGWIGFIAIFVYNIGGFILTLISLIQLCRKSIRQQLRQNRKQYYYQKVQKYQQSYDSDIPPEVLDSWVARGDLIDRWAQDQIKNGYIIKILVQTYMINKMGEGFTVQVDKISEIQVQKGQGYQDRLIVKRRQKGTMAVTATTSYYFTKLVQNIYSFYDAQFRSDFLTIKTKVQVDTSHYNNGQFVSYKQQVINQTIILQYPGQQPVNIELEKALDGFPVKQDLLSR